MGEGNWPMVGFNGVETGLMGGSTEEILGRLVVGEEQEGKKLEKGTCLVGFMVGAGCVPGDAWRWLY